MTTTTTINGTSYALITIRPETKGDMEPGKYWVSIPSYYDADQVTGEDIHWDSSLRVLHDWEAEDLGLAI